MKGTPVQIAIDGPVASGKGDIASRLAKQLGFLYVYTGAMYRALALLCIQSHVPFTDESRILALLSSHVIDMKAPHDGSVYHFSVFLDGVDVTERITYQDTAQGASDVGVLPRVRQWMVKAQQHIAEGKNVVMEGRDIARRVLPDAQLKVFLTASVEERALRRYKEWQKKDIQKTYEETLLDTKKRDAQDRSREIDPLEQVDGAWELDTTGISQDEVVSRIIGELRKRGLV